MSWVAVGGAVAGAAAGSILNKSGGSSGNQTVTNKAELDPRMAAILYGKGRTLKDGVKPIYKQNPSAAQPWPGVEASGMSAPQWDAIQQQNSQAGQELMNPESDYTTDSGLMGRVTGLLDRPQNSGMSGFGNEMDRYVGTWGDDNFYEAQNAARGLLGSNIGAPQAQASQINAPGQNNLNLSPAYQDMVYGAKGNNPFLESGINKAINQSTNAFGNYMTDATKATQDMLGNIRGGAIVNGAMGGSRQGIAEGRAIGDLTQNLGRAASQFGQNNTDSAMAARAGAYESDSNRALSAMSGLGAQQYGVATNDAQLQQQAALANQQARLTTNNLNSANQQAGIGSVSGLLGQAYGYGTNNDAYAGNKVGQVAGLLGPFTGLGGGSSSTQPLYQNQGAGIMGGAMMGSQIAKGLNFGSNNITSPYDPIFSGGGF
jgi:hypothetical protein